MCCVKRWPWKLAETSKEFSWNGSYQATDRSTDPGNPHRRDRPLPLPGHVVGMYRAVAATAAGDMGPNELSKAIGASPRGTTFLRGGCEARWNR